MITAAKARLELRAEIAEIEALSRQVQALAVSVDDLGSTEEPLSVSKMRDLARTSKKSLADVEARVADLDHRVDAIEKAIEKLSEKGDGADVKEKGASA